MRFDNTICNWNDSNEMIMTSWRLFRIVNRFHSFWVLYCCKASALCLNVCWVCVVCTLYNFLLVYLDWDSNKIGFNWLCLNNRNPCTITHFMYFVLEESYYKRQKKLATMWIKDETTVLTTYARMKEDWMMLVEHMFNLLLHVSLCSSR